MLMMTSILMRMGAPVGLFHMHGVKLGPDLRFQSCTQDGPYVRLAWITTKFLVFFFFLDAVSVFLQVFPPERNKSEGLSVK